MERTIRNTITRMLGVAAACLVMVLMPGEARAADTPPLLEVGGEDIVDNGNIVNETNWPDTIGYNHSTKTLTLNSYDGATVSLPIKADGIDLKIVLNGTSNINNDNAVPPIEVKNGSLTIEGGGILNLKHTGTTPPEGDCYGIYAEGGVTIDDSNITIDMDGNSGSIFGISSGGGVNIRDSVVTITAGAGEDACGISAGLDGVNIRNSAVRITTEDSSEDNVGISSYGDASFSGGLLDIQVGTGVLGVGIAVQGNITFDVTDAVEFVISTSGAGHPALMCDAVIILPCSDAAEIRHGANSGAGIVAEIEMKDLFGIAKTSQEYVSIKPLGGNGDGSGTEDPAHPARESGSRDKKKEVTIPAVAVIYDVQKSGDTFTFKTVIANAGGNMAGAAVDVKLNETYSTSVTIDQDGIGRGAIDAPGFTGDTANFSARPNLAGAGSVSTPYVIYTTGEVVRR